MMPTNRELFEQARALMPGGVNSPVRAFGTVGGTPPFLVSASGARMTDAEGRTYIDFVGSWGPMILGHAVPSVVEAIREAAGLGSSFGACHAGEIRLTGLIQDAMPHLERIRLVNSGTEAAMSALRLARAVTGRDGVIKFAGCYHGHADSFLVAAGSGALSCGAPSSPGVPAGAVRETRIATYNDLASVEAIFQDAPEEIACVIVEPVAGNMGVVPPADGFLAGLRALCDAYGALLIFDEVITGFRIGWGGAAERFGVTPDLTVLGKIIGGGLPVGAFGGRAQWMEQLAPLGPVYQAGTLSGNPLACAAGAALLETLKSEMPYERLDAWGARLADGMAETLRAAGCTGVVQRVGSMMTLFLGAEAIRSLDDATRCGEAYPVYFHAMLDAGIYLAPSPYEAMFLSAAHTEADLDAFLAAQAQALRAVVQAGGER